MAKAYPFTRTIQRMTVTALVFDKVTAEPHNEVVQIPETILDPKKLERRVAKMLENDTTKLIEIVDIVIEEKLYGLTAEAFMSNAVELDPKTRKPLAE